MSDGWQEHFSKSCSVGDVIQTRLSDDRTLTVQVLTPAAAALATELVLSGRWQKVSETTCEVPA